VQASLDYFQPSCSSFSLYPSPAFLLAFASLPALFKPLPVASLPLQCCGCVCGAMAALNEFSVAMGPTDMYEYVEF
jgi:hypothetical protein